MTGELVTIRYKEPTGRKNQFGQEVCEEVSLEVGNVLVQPVDTQDDGNRGESNRPDGAAVKYRLLFPKLFVYSHDIGILRGAVVEVRGKDYDIIGEPGAFDAENCPTEWCLSLYAGRIDG